MYKTNIFYRAESGVLSSFYSYFTMTESSNTKGPTPEEQEVTKFAQECIEECSLENLITDSRFLREESLQELVKVQIKCVRCKSTVSQSTLLLSSYNKVPIEGI